MRDPARVKTTVLSPTRYIRLVRLVPLVAILLSASWLRAQTPPQVPDAQPPQIAPAAQPLPSSHAFEQRNLSLLYRVVQRQVANRCLVLRNLCYAGTVGLEIGLLARQCKSAGVRSDA